MKKIAELVSLMVFFLAIANEAVFAHTHYGNSNEVVIPTQVPPGGLVTVLFDYTIWHSHGGAGVNTGWQIKFDSSVIANGTEWHPANGETITYSIVKDITIPTDTSIGFHTIEIVTTVEDGLWYSGYTRTSTLPLEVVYIDAVIDIDPDVLNQRSNGKWVTAYIELPSEYDVNNIDISSVRLEDSIPAVKGEVEGNTLMVKFNRNTLQSLIDSMGGEPNEVELSVTGKVSNMGFRGFDLIGVNY
jgi:hypothetical protein